MGGRTREIGASIAAGRKNRHMRAEAVHEPAAKAKRNDAPAPALIVHDEVDREILDEEFGLVPQCPAIKGVKDRVTRAIGRGASPLRGTFSVMGGHAAEGTLIDLAL